MSRDLTAGIVRILKPDGTAAGAGFVVSEDGLIATCAHVVEAASAGPCDTVRVAFYTTGEEWDAEVEPDWWRGPNAEDVAILRLKESLAEKVSRLPAGVTPLPLGSSSDAEGGTFRTFGFPDAKPVEGMVGHCEIIGHTTEAGFPVLQLRSSEVSPGFSGAPMWDNNLGMVVGMVVSIVRPDRYGRMAQTAFIIPVETLRSACSTLRLPDGEPYRGLQVFETEHADLYFGRDAATRELMDALSRQDVVLLVGVSGSGKSSLVRAGLEKGLRAQPVPGMVERVRYLLMPGSEPLLNLVLALGQVEGVAQESVVGVFDLADDALTDANRAATTQTLNARSAQALAASLRACAPPHGLLLIVDQFERLYTECPDESTRDRFFETLLAAAGDSVKVLLALRADFYGLALAHAGLEQVVKRGGQVTLGRIGEADLRAVVEEPARALGRSLQPGLAEQLVADVQERAGDLPLLEFSLTELWGRDNQKGLLTLTTYEALGYEAPDGQRFPGVQGAIAQRAEAVWQELDQAEQKAVRRVFLGLVTPGPVDERGERLTEDASRRAWRAELNEPARRVMEKLVTARLLTTGQDLFSGQPTVEVAHEALIRAWPRLQTWLVAHRPFMRWYEGDLAPFLRRWLSEGRHPDLLLPRAMLAHAQHWLARCPDELSGLPAEYIQASVEKEEQERAARERRRWRVTLGLVVGLVLALLLAGLTGVQWRRAEEQRKVALARQLTAQAQMALDNTGTGLVRSVLLAAEAMQRFSSLEADQIMRQGLALLPRPVVRLAHEYPVIAVTFSPDGRRLASGSRNSLGTPGEIRVWDVVTGQGVARMANEGGVYAVTWSPNGQWIASGGLDSKVRVWEAATGQEATWLAHKSGVYAVAFSPDGRWVASGSSDNTVWVWDVSAALNTRAVPGREVAHITHEDRVVAVTFSPDGRWVASGSWDSTARVWEAATGREVVRMVHSSEVNCVVFSPDGQWVASGSNDGTARVWEAATGQEVARMVHKGGVDAVVFSPDGQWVASGSGDGMVWVWEAATGQKVAQMACEDPVATLAFSTDGRLIASGSGRILLGGNGGGSVWEAATGQEVARLSEGGVYAVAFSPDGRQLASGGWGGMVAVLDIAAGSELTQVPNQEQVLTTVLPHGLWSRMIEGNTVEVLEAATGREVAQMVHEEMVRDMVLSPDGRWLVTGSGAWDRPGEVQVWDVVTGQVVTRMVHEGMVWVVAISPDGRRVASGSSDNTVRIWETATGREMARVVQERFVDAVGFSPDGQWLATTSGEETRIWKMDTGGGISIAHEGLEGTFVGFSPDGRRLATTRGSATLVWEVGTGRDVGQIALEGGVRAVAFSSGGQWLATAGWDRTVRVWEVAAGREIARPVHASAVQAVAFSPNGQWLVTVGTGDTAGVWLVWPEDLIAEACTRLPRNLTREEWRQYIGDEPYRPTCPSLPVPGE